MPILDSIKDPSTGKIKPVVLIAGGGIGLVALFLVAGNGSGGSSGGVVSGGQSSGNTEGLADLEAAIQGLAGGDLPEAPGGGGDSNVPPTVGLPPIVNPTNYDSDSYYPDNSYPVAAGYDSTGYSEPISFGNEPLPIPIKTALRTPATTGNNRATKSDALAAIKARAIAAGFSGSSASVAKTYNRDIAKGLTLEQIAKPAATKTSVSPSTPKGPTAAQLNAVRARAIAAGHRPTDAQVLATYNRYAK